jgi:hypothetical protein
MPRRRGTRLAKSATRHNEWSESSPQTLPSNVSVTRTGTYGGSDDRVNVTISGFQYILLTPGWSGSYNGRTISVSLPVEN